MQKFFLILVLICVASVVAHAQPTITSYSPARNTTASAQNADIALTWSTNMNFTTLTSGNIIVRGSMTGQKYSTTAVFSNNGSNQITLNPTANFKPGELISVTVTGATSLGGAQITHANIYSFTARPSAGTGNFTSRATVSVGNNPHSVALGDFNGDGILDIATANAGSNTVSIRLGDGAGGFSGITNIPVGSAPQSVAIGDFNGDGILDLAVANQYDASVSIRLGDGTGNFSGSIEVPTAVGSQAISVALGDFNGDGILDFATANYWNDNVSIRLGDGTGHFSGSTEISVARWPISVAIGDFNRDGILDFATTNNDGHNVSIRLGNGSGGFSGTTDLGGIFFPTSVAFGDFNGDGILDLGATNTLENKVAIRLGDGAGGFTSSTDISFGTYIYFVAFGDFNGDGILDMVTANYSDNTVSIRFGDGMGGFNGSTDNAVGSGPISIALGDFNGDGILDMAVANYNSSSVSILLGSANTPPTISAIHNMVLHAGTTNIVSFSISDAQTTAANLVVTATSSNLSFVASTGLTLSATSGNMTLGIIPTGNILSGLANITVSVSDGEFTTSATFTAEMDYKMQARKLIKLHPNESYTFTFTATDDQGHPYEGNVAVKDDVSSTQFSSHNFSNGTVSHTVTVPGGKAAGIYAVKFTADNLVDVEYVEVLP